MHNQLLRGRFHTLIIPDRPHIPAEDGGHLVILPNRQVQDTIELSDDEAIELHVLQSFAKRVMASAFGVDFFNTQENGNWSALKPREQQQAHIHIYGRAQHSLTQTFGDALYFPNDMVCVPYSEKDKAALYDAARAELRSDRLEPLYRTMNGIYELASTYQERLKYKI